MVLLPAAPNEDCPDDTDKSRRCKEPDERPELRNLVRVQYIHLLRGRSIALSRHRLLVGPVLGYGQDLYDAVGLLIDHHLGDGLDALLKQIVSQIHDGVR